jgi:hypothetical protein
LFSAARGTLEKFFKRLPILDIEPSVSSDLCRTSAAGGGLCSQLGEVLVILPRLKPDQYLSRHHDGQTTDAVQSLSQKIVTVNSAMLETNQQLTSLKDLRSRVDVLRGYL